MPTLEVQLTKAQTSLAEIEKLFNPHYCPPNLRVDEQHGNHAERRGLRERIRYLQQRLAIRNERAELHAAAAALMLLREQRVELPLHVTHTSEPTAPA